MQNRLDAFEKSLKYLFENTVARLFAGDYLAQEIAQVIVKALHSGVISGDSLIAPARYTIALPMRVRQKLSEERILAILQTATASAVEEAGFRQVHPPVFDFLVSETDGMIATAFPYTEQMEQTQGLEISKEMGLGRENGATAYLILSEGEFFPLSEGITNIGRLPDNHLVLDYPSISRRHAQIRRSSGKYIIFDLDSRGGTFINSSRVQQRELLTGDVIGLAEIKLIFAHEEEPIQDTHPAPPDLIP